MYLWLGVSFIIPWGIIYYLKPQYRSRMLKTGLIAAPFGFIEDYWYRVDYWNPPELFDMYPIDIEDIIFAFLSTGITIAIYDALFTEKQVKHYKPRPKLAVFFMPLIVAAFFLLHNVLGINSMYMCAIPFFVVAFFVVLMRRDLLIPSIASAFLVTLIMIPIYMVLFNVIHPTFWDKYWFLIDTKHGITILGNVALLELLYYFSFACLAGIMYDFAKGTKKVYKSPFKFLN